MSKSVLKVIALDFDGTLVESNHIKDRAFETIFSEWPEHKEAMLEWHRSRNTIDRREKFRYFVEKVLCQWGDEELINQLTDKFTELTRQAIVNCPMVAGAQNFLDEHLNKAPLFLISATPQNELDEILERRGLRRYFKRTYGAPINKVAVLKKIMIDKKASPNEMLYIGDSLEDQLVAESLSIHFIGRQSDRELNGVTYSVYTDFIKIKDHLDQNYEL